MANGCELWVYQRIYEPQLVGDNKWTVHYKSQHDNAWKQETFTDHEQAYNFYYAKYRELQVYYNTFLRELGVKQK